MEAGDWVQSIIGVVGILATLVVAWMVYRLESKDRKKQQAAEKAIETTARQEVQEREKRAIRREQHKDDYKAAIDALDILEKGFRSATNDPLSEDGLKEIEFGRATEVIDRIAKRVPSLQSYLNDAWINASMLEVHTWPDKAEIDFALRHEDAIKEDLPNLLRKVVSAGIAQNEYGNKGLKAVSNARKAISQEWGS